jgi:NadR type nicotinamide-nucleotide adenylyltransferase
MTISSICLIGPESTGKTTLARALAEFYGTIFVPEFGRLYCELFGNECEVDDLRAIVEGHNLLSRAARRRIGERMLILDTDAVMTAIWANVLLGYRPEDLDRVEDLADLYFLTDVDVPFVSDAIRYFPDQRERVKFFERCREELEGRRLSYVVLSGAHDLRFKRAVEAIETVQGMHGGNRPDNP